MTERPLWGEQMSAREAIAADAKREIEWRKKQGLKAPSQSEMEATYRNALNRTERQKAGG